MERPSESSAFTQDGPWRIDRKALPWLVGAAERRAAAQAEIPRLVTPRRLPPLGRFLGAGFQLGRALLGWRANEYRLRDSASRAGLSKRLRRAFEALGPAYIKLGQVISSGQGLFPEELVEEFALLRDQVPPESFDDVKRVIEEDLGRPLAEVFASIDPEPLAAASIAQVHAARLSSGEQVVVKVQRPQVAALVKRDIAAMAWIAPLLVGRIPVAALANPPALVELFAETISEEIDFRLEAENMLDVADVLQAAGSKIILVPRPHPELVTPRVLVMERLSGFKYDDVEAMRSAGVDTEEVVRALMISFLEGAMIYGVFHGDLHGGNLFVTPDGHVALFDYGITARMDPGQRQAFLRMMMTGAVNDVRGQVEALRDLGALPADADIDHILSILKADQPVKDPTKMSSDELASEVSDLIKGLLAQGARLPKHLMLYVKGMLFFDGALSKLAPDLDMLQETARIYGYFAMRHGQRIQADIGFDPAANPINLDGMRKQMGLEGEVASITHRELQERRKVISERLEESDLDQRLR